MVFGGRFVRIAGVRFTNQQAMFLTAGIRQGLGVRQIRTLFRAQFDRGLPSTAFTATRRTLSQADLAGVRLQRLGEGRRLRVGVIPRVNVVRPRSRFLFTGKIRARIPSTGTLVERVIRFGTDEQPTAALFRQRAAEILSKGVAQLESAMIIDEVDSFSVVEQIQI